MPEADQRIVSHTAQYKWTHGKAAELFEVGDVLRIVSLILVMFTAVHSVMTRRKQYGLAGLCIVSILESLLRLPLSVQEDVMKKQIVVVTVMYCVTLLLFLVPMIGVFGASLVGSATAIVSLSATLLTNKVKL